MPFSFWLAFAAYLVPTFPLGYFWHLTTFKQAYERLEIYRTDVMIPLGLSSMLLQAAVFAWAYPKLFDTSRNAWPSSALGAFALFGALSWSFSTLAVAAKNRMNAPLRFVAIETAFTAVQFAIVAPLMALAWRSAT